MPYNLHTYPKPKLDYVYTLNDSITPHTYLEIPENQDLIALIPIGYPAEAPVAPKRKPVTDLLSYQQ